MAVCIDTLIANTVHRLNILEDELNRAFVQRQQQIRDALLALIAREHCLFLGPPGTAKSMLVRAITRAITGCRYFEYLLNRTTDPAAIVGPYSLKALEEDRFTRVYDSYLPAAHIAFIDEIYKANEPVLNILLSILNERRFHNDGQVVNVPLVTAFFASNEGPEDESLLALHDRILFRSIVNYVDGIDDFIKILTSNADSYVPSVAFTLEELEQLHAYAMTIPIPDEVINALVELRKLLYADEIVISDRRWVLCLKVLRASAVLHGRSVVGLPDLKSLVSVLWQYPEHIVVIARHVSSLIDPYTTAMDRLVEQVNSVITEAEEHLLASSNKIQWLQHATDTVCRLSALLRKADETIASATNTAGLDESILNDLRRARSKVKKTVDDFMNRNGIDQAVMRSLCDVPQFPASFGERRDR